MDKEATDGGIISESPEVIKLKGRARRDSTGKTNPIGSLSLSNSDGKLLPRYLRPSMSSCHDFCKYGRKNPSEAEGKHRFRRRSMDHKITPDEEHNWINSSVLGERMKRPVIESRASSRLKLEFSDTPKVNKKNDLLPAKGIGMFEKHLNSKLEMPTSMENELNQVIKLKTALQPKTSQPKVVNQNNPSPANEVDALGEPDIVEKMSASHVKKSISSVKPNLIKQKASSPIKKSIPSVKSQVLKQKASSPLDRIGLSAKPAVTVKRKTAVVKPIPVLNPLRGIISRRNQEDNAMKTLSISKIGEKKVLKLPAASFSSKTPGNYVSRMKPRKYRNPKHASPAKNQEIFAKAESDSDDIKEKTLCVVEPEKENVEFDLIHQTSENTRTSPSNYKEEEIKESDSTISDASESDSDEEAAESEVEFPKGEEKRRHRRTTTAHPEESFSTPHKLRFRRGKVIDLQLETNGPRRLRFNRRGRMVSENPNGNGEVGTVSLRSGKLGSPVLNDPGSEAQAVVLRCQEMQGGKESQGLFNHVIEQTATKLVETRKSKVQALVGAFETVISLQESKLASTV